MGDTLLIEGFVDAIDDGRLCGWAWAPADPQDAVTIEAWVDGVRVDIFAADAFRGDLKAAGKRGGYCAFDRKIAGPAGAVVTVKASLGPESLQSELVGSPILMPALSISAPAPLGLQTLDVDIFPVPFGQASGVIGFIDQCGPHRIRGWVQGATSKTLNLHVFADSVMVVSAPANQWRPDVAESLDGDGCCGFDIALPVSLCDGEIHLLDIQSSDDSGSLLDRPVRVRLGTSGHSGRSPQQFPPALVRERVSTSAVTLSIIVNFYNMPREAARTLASLTRAYQNPEEAFSYEVICIDNGSSPPIDAAWVGQYGPEFRLFKPSVHLGSPCKAINEAALAARGKYLGVMIDGAHVLSPGVFREAIDAWRHDALSVVALRHWFVGGDQRWLAALGYTREQEDELFERIRWPTNGYELFRISAPIGESPEPWFDGLSESNCLLLPAALYDSLGGMDEKFDTAGGGFANLDLWRRAADASQGPLVALVGEATFHQFHEGTTTNVEDMEKDRRVRQYANAYRSIRGSDFSSVHRSRLSLRGTVRSEFATGVRQRPLMPLRLPVGDRIRPGQMALHFDEGAQTYLQSVYAESGLLSESRWRGVPTDVAPGDLVNIQEIVHQLQPDCIVVAGASAGFIRFITDIANMVVPMARVVHVGQANSSKTDAGCNSLVTVTGAPYDPATVDTVRHALIASESVMVLLASGTESHDALRESMARYMELVSHRSYLVVLDSLLGQPWLGYSTRQPRKLIRELIARHPEFVIDRSWNQHLVTTSPGGYLRRVGGTVSVMNDDEKMDQTLENFFDPQHSKN